MDKLKKVPNIRFEGYDNTWHKDKLSELCDVRDGTHDSPKYLDSGYYFITSKNVKRGYINFDEIKFISKEDYDNINKRSKVDVGDILFGMIGTIGNIAIVRKEPNYAIKNVALIKDIKKLYNYFNYYFLQSPNIENQLDSGLDGGTQKFVSLKSIRGLDVIFPKYKEQTQIGNFFKTLDEKLELEKEKHEKLINYKNAMLEDMFPKEGEKVPKIRFNGFDEEWERITIGNMITSIPSKRYIANSIDNRMDGKVVLQQGDHPIVGYTSDYDSFYSDYSNVLLFGDHTLSLYMPKKEFVLATDGMKIITSENINVGYLYYLIKSNMMLSEGYKRYFNIIKNISVSYTTNCQEQVLIGNFFKNLDEKIELSEQKIVKIENFKKAMLDKMFV